jgi:hypothetical protein
VEGVGFAFRLPPQLQGATPSPAVPPCRRQVGFRFRASSYRISRRLVGFRASSYRISRRQVGFRASSYRIRIRAVDAGLGV